MKRETEENQNAHSPHIRLNSNILQCKRVRTKANTEAVRQTLQITVYEKICGQTKIATVY